MDRSVCQSCHAALDDDQFASTGVAECPFCGAPLPDLGTSLAENDPLRTACEVAGLVRGQLQPVGFELQDE